MLFILLGVIVSSVVFIIIYAFKIKPKLDKVVKINTSAQEINIQTEKEYKTWTAKKQQLEQEIESLSELRLILEKDISSASAKKEEQLISIQELKAQINDNASMYYNNIMSEIQDRLSENAQAQGDYYQQQVEDYKQDYLSVMEEAAAAFNIELQEKKEQLIKIDHMLVDLKTKLQNAIDACKRAEENNKDKYRLILSDIDLNEIIRLKEITPYLREARPLNKMIWEGYYQKPYKDLISRTFGDKKIITGIYKLTDLTNNKSYIGQAVDIASRWSEHIKKGLGIDTNNQIIYTAMKKVGPENFTFEVLEECSSKELNEKEKYWITFFKTMEYGYNMKVG